MLNPLRILILFFIFIEAELFAQLSQPVISLSDLNWGWFTLTMTGYNQYPANTRWLIREGADTVLDPRWGLCSEILYPFIADRCDLTTKQILGCKANTTYTARVCYNNNSEWSPYSEQITFTTPSELPKPENDTIFIVLWGHSLIHLGDLCDIKTTIRLGEDNSFLRDNIAHMLQTELKRITNLPIKVINRGHYGTFQADWFRGDSLYKAYLPGGEYENTNKYKYAIFFFGSNDCNWNYPSPQYGDDIRWIINFLLSKNVKVIYNSIHHTTSLNYANQDSQVVYRNVWNTVMNEYSGNPNVKRGLDLYNLFLDTIRYMWNDGIHCNLSEGMPQLVRIFAPMIKEFAGIKNTGTIIPEKYSLYQNYPNPFNPATRIKFDIASNVKGQAADVKLIIYDILGREISKLVNEKFQPGTYEITFDGSNLPSGVYFYKLSAGNYEETKKLVLLK